MNERLKQLILQTCEGLEKCPYHRNTNWVVRTSLVDEKEIIFKAVCAVCMASEDPRYARIHTVSQEDFISRATLTAGDPKALEASDELFNTRLLVNVVTQEVKEVAAPPIT